MGKSKGRVFFGGFGTHACEFGVLGLRRDVHHFCGDVPLKQINMGDSGRPSTEGTSYNTEDGCQDLSDRLKGNTLSHDEVN